jgi:AsmA protein
MKKLKLVLKILGVVIVILLLALAAFIFTFDPNNYKDTIKAQVEKQTGRDFEIAGDIRLSVFPWVGVKVEDVMLANAPGFSHEPFARMSQLDVKVMLMPLLRKELQVDKVRLHGLFASLEVDEQGNSNWADLAGQEQVSQQQPVQEQTADADTQAPTLAALAINGVELIDATVKWTDLQNNVRSHLSGFSLTTGAIRFNEAVDIELNTSVKHNEPELDAQINLTTKLTFNEAFTNVLLDALLIKVAANAPEFFAEQLDLLLEANINVDVDQQVASLTNTRLTALDTTVHTNVDVTNLLSQPVVSGNLHTDDINARDLMERLGIEPPPMAGENSLTKLAYASTFKASTNTIEMNAIKLTLDDTNITGWLHVPDIQQPMVRYKLHMTPIDADAYMAPVVQATTDEQAAIGPTEGEAAAEVDAGAGAAEDDPEIVLPVEILRTLNMEGELNIDMVTINQIPLADIIVKTQAKSGIVRVDPLQLKTLEGTVNGSVMTNVKGETPQYSVALNASNIRPGPVVDPMLVGVFGEQQVTLEGSANMLVDVKTGGARLSKLKKSATGKMTFDMDKTVLQGVDFEHFVRNVVADYLAGKSLPVPADWRGQLNPQTKTAFNRAHASAVLANGDITNPDLILDSTRLKVTGQGVVNIMRNDMDYRALVDIKPPRRQTTADKLLDQPLPVHIHGPFELLAYDVDTSQIASAMASLLEAEAKAKINKELEEEKAKLREKAKQEEDKLREKAKQEEDEIKQQLEDKLKDKLKGLF